jgi:hypothetical protein
MLGALIRRVRRRPPTVLIIGVVAWWLLLGGAIIWLMPEPTAAASSSRGVAVVPGQTARIHQPGMTWWPVPVDRVGFDLFQRGSRESDERVITEAFEVSEWIEARHGQAVRVLAVDGDAIQVELLEGTFRGRRAWLVPRHLSPLP